MDVGGNVKLSSLAAVGWYGKLIQNFILLFLKNPMQDRIVLLDSESGAKNL